MIFDAYRQQENDLGRPRGRKSNTAQELISHFPRPSLL